MEPEFSLPCPQQPAACAYLNQTNLVLALKSNILQYTVFPPSLPRCLSLRFPSISLIPRTCYIRPHYVFLSSLLFPPSSAHIPSPAPYSQTPSANALPSIYESKFHNHTKQQTLIVAERSIRGQICKPDMSAVDAETALYVTFIQQYTSAPRNWAWPKKVGALHGIFAILTQPVMNMERKESRCFHPPDSGPLLHSSLHTLLFYQQTMQCRPQQ
jgi:hypothetical protein